MWKHPKYYKELRKLRNKTDQAISQANSTRGLSDVRSGPGPVKLYRGSRIMELAACGLQLEACCLGLEACYLFLSELGA